jgi:hypothetical protein
VSSPDKHIGWKETLEYYMYPLLLACYTRHGSAAQAAVTGLTHCLDEGVFDSPGSDLCRLEVVIDAVTSICQQGVKSRFEPTLQFFQKVRRVWLLRCISTTNAGLPFHQVIRKSCKGFDPNVLHAILKALTFIGDFDSSMAKSFEDELISKIMCAYESTLISEDSLVVQHPDQTLEQSSSVLTRELVVDLIDDISTGAEIATITDNMLGVFKVKRSPADSV